MAKVSFIGAGPGDPELITVKGVNRIKQAGLILYAGSLVPEEVITGYSGLPEDRIINTAGLNLEQTHDLMVEAVGKGEDVARVHTGDPSLYGAIDEQILLLENEGIECEVIPGISSAFAAAAALKTQLTVPGSSQTVIFTRLGARTPVPESEDLEKLAAHGSTIIVFLSGQLVREVVERLLAHYPADTPAAVVYRVGWPDQKLFRAELEKVPELMKQEGITRQVLIMVGPGMARKDSRSKLYDKDFSHGYRH
ncbi:MAG: precorrin-4 C(11)-methyltransferase [bacterium]